MTVEELVEEGDDFRINHPRASVRGVRAHLEKLIEDTPDETRERVGRAVAQGPEGCLISLLLWPMFALFHAFKQRAHRRRVARAIRILFPTDRS
ncbi:MAG TPA: hypothetical protein VH092_12890 [Urbifossiella sp.]|jgi:hypothetical protein|nr:hypothetical protein [Urbifossiella sp.]